MINPSVFYFGAKDLSFSIDCRNQMLAGCEKLADAVQVTLGKKLIKKIKKKKERKIKIKFSKLKRLNCLFNNS
jgi:chaperonin GroEL (HSP60 family)